MLAPDPTDVAVERSLLAIARHLERAGEPTVELDVLDPDRGRGLHAGECIAIDGASYVHRPFRTWVDLAERLGYRLATPRPLAPPRLRLVFERLAPAECEPIDDATEKYGAASRFARTSKLEDPGFVLDFAEAIERAALPSDARVLDLGVNQGDELALIAALRPDLAEAAFTGVDHSATALAVARARFPRATLVEANLDAPLALTGLFVLVVAIATLQSAAIDDRELLRRIVQHHLAPNGAVIFGVPNCRIVDGETQYGARMKNFRQPELGLLVKDVAFYRKHLQQHGRRVFVTGKNYVFVTAIV
jgi:SAM-dependent methyltransferase